MRNVNQKIILSVLVLLALSNLIFFIISSYSGPIIGFIIATIIAIHWWQKRNSRSIMVIAIAWISIHIYELTKFGISPYRVIIFLNLLLPIPLFYCGLRIYLLLKKEKKKLSATLQDG